MIPLPYELLTFYLMIIPSTHVLQSLVVNIYKHVVPQLVTLLAIATDACSDQSYNGSAQHLG